MIQRPSTYQWLDCQTWQLTLDVYAKSLYDDERMDSSRKVADMSLTWNELPSDDRDIYRELALRLIKETNWIIDREEG